MHQIKQVYDKCDLYLENIIDNGGMQIKVREKGGD
jgi:hypothetical protein